MQSVYKTVASSVDKRHTVAIITLQIDRSLKLKPRERTAWLGPAVPERRNQRSASVGG